ncbi:MAG: hypothetical protein GX452_11815 [Ignavibacteriales bacterium]|nr:hypothetical protein [Ignavibacteriales bacterium]
MAKVNWEEIRNKYIYGIEKDGKLEFPTIQDLADECNIARETISRRSSKEGWAKARSDYITERAQKRHEKAIEHFADELIPFDTDLFEKAKRISKKIDALIEKIEKPNDSFILTNTLKQLKEVEDSLVGEVTVKSDRAKDIERALEELRCSLESLKDDDI